MRRYLGVDGGGTKTAFVLIGSDGRVLARANLPTSDYHSHGIGRVTEVLQGGIREICDAAGIRPEGIDSAFFGLPGYGEVSAMVPQLDAAPAAILGHTRYRCNNDMVAGWAGSLGTEDGINVIAGTGSMTYGERAGVGTRVGGWGELFGDEGSGHWIGLTGLNLFSRMSDGRLPRGPLHEFIKEHTGVTRDLDVIDVVFNRWRRGRTEIAALSRVVAQAAEAGDQAAAEVLREAAAHLTELVEATRHTLEFEPGETVPVSYSGGVFAAATVLERFTAALRERSADYDLRAPLFAPVVGAALYAAKISGHPLPAEALVRLRG